MIAMLLMLAVIGLLFGLAVNGLDEALKARDRRASNARRQRARRKLAEHRLGDMVVAGDIAAPHEWM